MEMEEFKAQTSAALAELKTHITQIHKNTDDTRVKVDSMHDRVIVNSEAIKSAHKRLDSIEGTAKETAKEFAAFKNKGLGIFAGVSLTGGGLGALLMKVFTGGS